MKKLNAITIFNIAFLVCCLISDFCYLFIDASEYITKTIASSVFVIGGLVNLIYVLKNQYYYSEHKNFKWFMMIGLVFACMGDLFLIDFFELGVIFFALGHVFYFISFCFVEKFKWKDLIYGGLLFVACALVIFLYKGFEFNGMRPLILIYALIISLMVGKTISNFIGNRTINNLILLVGSSMFFLSDLFLLFRLFASWGRIGSILCLVFYYPAQFVLALTILLVSKSNVKGEK